MSVKIILKRSPVSKKKFRAIVKTPVGDKNVDFGASGYSDYTKHHNPKRKENYISRHRKRENWTKSGIGTAGFWSRWLLWNKPSLSESISDIEKRFNVKIKKMY